MAEQRLLASLCQDALGRPARVDVLRRLAGYTFADPEHEVIFHALAKMPLADPERTGADTRAELSVRITRLGFPDCDLAPFFSIAPPGPSEIAALLASLEI